MPQNNHDEIACVFRCIRSPVRGRLRSVDDSLASALEGIAQIRQSCIETLLRDVLSEYGPCHSQARNGSDSRGACCDLGPCAPALLLIRSRSSGGSGWSGWSGCSGCRSSHDHVFERRNRHKHRLAILGILGHIDLDQLGLVLGVRDRYSSALAARRHPDAHRGAGLSHGGRGWLQLMGWSNLTGFSCCGILLRHVLEIDLVFLLAVPELGIRKSSQECTLENLVLVLGVVLPLAR